MAVSKPSTNGKGVPAPRVPLTVMQSFAGSESATPFGLEVHICIAFAPNTSGTAFNGTETVASDARLPVQLNVCIVVPFLITVIVTDVSALEPTFLNVTVNGIVGSQVTKPAGGVLIADMPALFRSQNQGYTTIGSCQSLRFGYVVNAVCIRVILSIS